MAPLPLILGILTNAAARNDCHPVPCAELVLTPEGDVKWKGVLYFSRRMVRLSLDEQCHVYVEEGLSASVIPYLPLCVFVPHATS